MQAVLLDFGLARDAAPSDVSTPGAVVGTPNYMAWEQAEAEGLPVISPGQDTGFGLTIESASEWEIFRDGVQSMKARADDSRDSSC